MILPAGTSVFLALTNPVMTGSAKAGDSIYAETTFPVAANTRMAIPAGTDVQGVIDAVARPGKFSTHAQLQIHFTKVIFTNGYTVELPSPPDAGATPLPNDVAAAVANPYVLVSPRSDVLLDNGTQIEMVLQVPLLLDSARVAAAARESQPYAADRFCSASRCRPTPGWPGTPDTVIPGTPGTPGTPPTVIPGAPGTPDIVIPGIPATPGTPATVMPGSPATPGIPCPGPPLVTANSKVQLYREAFQLAAPVQIAGTPLAAGSYELAWKGLGAPVQVTFAQKGKFVASVRARVVWLNRKPSADVPQMATQPDGSISLLSVRFAGETFALYFDPGPA